MLDDTDTEERCSYDAWLWAQRQQRTANMMVGAKPATGLWMLAGGTVAGIVALALVLIWM